MSLEKPVERKMIHTRRVECVGYLREDGLWDIEGSIVDTKSYDYDTSERIVVSGTPMHNMFLRLTLDDGLLIRDAVAHTEDAPFSLCQQSNPLYRQLIGMRVMGDGFSRKVREMFRGTCGCTHITDLIGPVATTAYQTIATWLYEQNGRPADPRMLDICFSFDRDGEVVKRHFAELIATSDQ
jgi:hypothetical protein